MLGHIIPLGLGALRAAGVYKQAIGPLIEILHNHCSSPMKLVFIIPPKQYDFKPPFFFTFLAFSSDGKANNITNSANINPIIEIDR